MMLNNRADRARLRTTGTVRLPGFVLNLGVHSPGSLLPQHMHDDPTICYVLRGGFTEHWRGSAADCVSETLKVTPAGELHWNRFSTVETRGLRMDVDREHFADSRSIFRVLDERMHSRASAAGDIAKRLVYELASDDDTALVAAEGLALELLVELSREPIPRMTRPPRWLLEADELIHEVYATRFSIGDIARAVGVEPATLARAYRRVFGCTVGERIRRLRVNHAAGALIETREPLSAIALNAGFYDQPHFTNIFRRYVGVTPAEYRARLG
jgi:AraC family transcriptional regulator